MSFIPSTFDEHQINMTVLGGKVNYSPDVLNISVILLNSSASHLKLNVFENLMGCNFRSIISIEHDSSNYSIEDMIAVKRNKKCPICGDYLIFKRGKFGAFYGCHSYPRCDYTEKYEK